MTILNNPFNYVGGKDKLLKQIIDNLDTTKSDFLDLFCGSGVVGVNVSDMFKYVHLNDGCWQVIRTIEYFRDTCTSIVLQEVDQFIKFFRLTKTDKEAYLEARRYYNEFHRTYEKFNPALFYALLTHSFSYNITFNSKQEFNVPAGTNRSNFNKSIRSKLVNFSNKLTEKCPTTTAFRFDLLLSTLFSGELRDLSEYMIYSDSPYFNSDSTYSRIHGLKWTEKEEVTLYKYMDMINDCGGSFLLSNTVENNGKTNNILREWMTKYNVIEVDMSYKGCSYQRKNNGETREVMIRNY